MKTRSKGPSKSSAKTAAASDESSATATASLPASVENPPKTFILPKNVSPDARIITLANPATSSPNRYYFCPQKGFFEFTKIAAPKSAARSWLFAPDERKGSTSGAPDTAPNKGKAEIARHDAAGQLPSGVANGFITKNADLFIATPIDALFLLLPALCQSKASKDTQKQMFLALDDHLDALGESSKHLKKLLRDEKCRRLLEGRLGVMCDTVDAGDEKMYRLSKEKLAQTLLAKAQTMAGKGFPTSMEENLVRRALETPIMSVRREDTTTSIASAVADGEASESQPTEATESQTSNSTAATSVATATATPIEDSPKNAVSEDIVKLLRIRTAFNFICSSYLAPHIKKEMQDMLTSQTSIDFAPLNNHLQHIASLRSEAQALRSMSDNISRKRNFDDDEQAEIRAEKKRKKEEEEKKKKQQSRGVKELAKVNTSGMKKLSAFFTKVPAKKDANA